jgi:hypothetical protein
MNEKIASSRTIVFSAVFEMNGIIPTWRLLAFLVFSVSLASAGFGQDDEPPISLGDSSVGYIDSAIPAHTARLRFDAAYNINKPNRGEFLWAWPPPDGNGPTGDERNSDYQSVMAYGEILLLPRLSVLIEVPFLAVNPDILPNATGFGDLIGGFKYAFHETCDSVTTFQLKTYIFTGDAERALGVGHTSLEPGLLHFRRLNDLWRMEGELRLLVPLDGTEGRQSPVFRYGLGVSGVVWSSDCWRLSPVLEAVGWTLTDGMARFLDDSGTVVVEDAAGDTIVNLKFGARLSTCRQDFYAGYGRVLTDERWYSDVFRVEWRYRF